MDSELNNGGAYRKCEAFGKARRPEPVCLVVRCAWRFISAKVLKKRRWIVRHLFPHLWEVSTDNNRFKKTTMGDPGPTHLYFGTWDQLMRHLDHCPMASAVSDIGSCYKNHIGGICRNILGKLGRFCYRSFRRLNLFRSANP